MNSSPVQSAVQLIGPRELRLSRSKPVPQPGPRQILVRVEAVGLCFSDLKLLAQFSGHVRKAPVLSGVDPSILEGLSSYVPGEAPTVPGHEVACRVEAVGPGVLHYRPGQRFIVQADYRPLKTPGSNGAFGYNFEGGLQQRVLMDERIIGDPSDEESFMIPVPDGRPASQLALVEPWACVESSYASPVRSTPAPGDIVLRSPSPEEVEEAAAKLGTGGFLAVVQEGRKLGRPVRLDLGSLHYRGQRFIGSLTGDLDDAWRMAPPSAEFRPDDRVLIVGAGGPMGQMHAIRTLAQGRGEAVCTDSSPERLESLARRLAPWRGQFRTVLPQELGPEEAFDGIALMAPIPSLVQDAVRRARPRALINIFAGIPVGTWAEIDLDSLIEKQAFMYGTSGSEPGDMRAVLKKVLAGTIDTNLSVAAVSGMAGAIDGLHAVENRTLDGKIVVYPSLEDMPLIPLAEMARWYPAVAAAMSGGQWTADAEAELLRTAG